MRWRAHRRADQTWSHLSTVACQCTVVQRTSRLAHLIPWLADVLWRCLCPGIRAVAYRWRRLSSSSAYMTAYRPDQLAAPMYAERRHIPLGTIWACASSCGSVNLCGKFPTCPGSDWSVERFSCPCIVQPKRNNQSSKPSTDHCRSSRGNRASSHSAVPDNGLIVFKPKYSTQYQSISVQSRQPVIWSKNDASK